MSDITGPDRNTSTTLTDYIMASFEQALAKTLRNEGGYVNDPDDPGGETYKGIARKIFSTWEGWPVIDAQKRLSGFPTSLENNYELQDKISQFYKTHFWDRLLGDQLGDDHVAYSLFDFAVNAGAGTSVVLAQHVADVHADGVMGPATVQAINAMQPEHFLASFTVAKVVRYIAIVNQRPTSRKYFFGWVSRAVNS